MFDMVINERVKIIRLRQKIYIYIFAHTTFDGYEAGVLYAPEGLIQRIIPEYPVDSINIVAQLSVEVRDGEPSKIYKLFNFMLCKCVVHSVKQDVSKGHYLVRAVQFNVNRKILHQKPVAKSTVDIQDVATIT